VGHGKLLARGESQGIKASSSRGQFLLKTLPAGTLFCLGCKSLMAAPDILGGQKASTQKHKFLGDSGMTIEQVFRFSFEGSIPIFQNLAIDMGRDKFLEMLKKASNENTAQFVKRATKDIPKRDFPAFVDWKRRN
jgi:hypothetical protein